MCTVALAFLACLPTLATTSASDEAHAVSAVPAALAAQAIPQVATSPDTTPTAITGVTVIDVARGRRVPAQTVVVRGTRIISVGASALVKAPASARVVDGRGKFLIPGLWDMHVHTFRNRMDAPGVNTNDSDVFFPAFIANGVTGVRDMSTDLADNTQIREWAAQVVAGTLIAPRMIGGSPLLDGVPPTHPNAIAVATAADARRIVDSLVDGGVGFIKVYGGLSREVYFAIAEQAKRRGVPFAGHKPGLVASAEASDAGQRSFEHLGAAINSCSADLRTRFAQYTALQQVPGISRDSVQALGRARDRDLITRFDVRDCAPRFAQYVRNDTWQVPTFAVKFGRATSRDSATLTDQRLRFVSPQLMDEWRTISFPSMLAEATKDYEMRLPYVRFEQRYIGAMRNAGVGIMAGTDLHNAYVYPGFSLHDELQFLVESGLSPLDALRAATLNPARFLRAIDSLGSVATGKLADLVLLDADPLVDIHNTTRIRAVVANGRFFDRAALDTLLATAERAARPQAAPQSSTELQPDTARYVILNHGRLAGEMDVVTAGDSVVVRVEVHDRGLDRRNLTTYHLDAQGAVRRLERSGPATERFQRESGIAQWSSPGEAGQAPAGSVAVYQPRIPTAYDNALLARAMLRRPDRTVPLLPAETAHLEIAVDTVLPVGGSTQRLRLAVIEGTPPFGAAVWLDERDELVASEASWFITVRRGAESLLPALRTIEMAHTAHEAEELARRLTVARRGPIVIRNGNVFDSERGVVRPRTSIVVQGDRIVAVGPTDSIGVPRGATMIEATGKTVLPGLWDMHTHTVLNRRLPVEGLLWLAAGITTVRDLGGDPDLLLHARLGAEVGRLLSPRFVLTGWIDGPGRQAGPTEAIVATEEEAVAWIARYDSLGYRQIKLYHLVHPDLVPVIAAEAHRRGLRLSGHIPRGLSVPAAIHLGYDEIQHANHLFSTFFPDSHYVPRPRSYAGVANAVAPTYDVDSREMTALVALLRERGTVIDGTFNRVEGRGRPLPDGTDPVYGPTLAWLSPIMRRAHLPGVLPTARDSTLGQARNASYRRLLKRLFDGGVTLVAGTDDFATDVPGLTYHGELEVYQRAGIPAASVLQIATIVPARVMKEERDYGSITPGKIADLVIVDGRPDQDIRDLRRAEWVMRAGRTYRTVDLYRAAGLTPTRVVRAAPASGLRTAALPTALYSSAWRARVVERSRGCSQRYPATARDARPLCPSSVERTALHAAAEPER